MLQKNKSRRIALAKYGLSAPLFILMLVLSSATINNSKVVTAIHQKAASAFSTSAEDVITNLTDEGKIPEESIDISVIKQNKESNSHYGIGSHINMIQAPEVAAMFIHLFESKPQFSRLTY